MSTLDNQIENNKVTPQFFSKDENQIIIKNFAMDLRDIQETESNSKLILQHLKVFIDVLKSNCAIFDKHCTLSIETNFEHFISLLNEFPKQETKESLSNQLARIFVLSYSYLCELEFNQREGLRSSQLFAIKEFVHRNLDKFDDTNKQLLIEASYFMPAAIIKNSLNSPEMSAFMSFTHRAEEVLNLKQKWDEELDIKKGEVQTLKESLDHFKTAYNFVGLVKGFETLGVDKQKERRFAFVSLLFLGACMVAPVAIQIWFTMTHIDTITSYRDTYIYTLPAVITLEVILLYLFRIVLLHFRGIAAQILQIKLRISLCQFIQNYSEYSMQIKKQDVGALEKFESLIFSSIMPSNENVPSTFDGVEQISKLINSVRAGK